MPSRFPNLCFADLATDNYIGYFDEPRDIRRIGDRLYEKGMKFKCLKLENWGDDENDMAMEAARENQGEKNGEDNSEKLTAKMTKG